MIKISLKGTAFKEKTLTVILAVIAAIALPQLFHPVGAVSGVGAVMGAAFMPMYLPVLLAGLLGGPLAGILVGTASPFISHLLS